MESDRLYKILKMELETTEKKIIKKNWDDLIRWSEKYKKIDTETVKTKSMNPNQYLKTMNLELSRILFRKSAFLLHTVKMNWKNKYRGDSLECEDCLGLDPPASHLNAQDLLMSPTCVGNSDLRIGRDMSNLLHQAHFFRDLTSRKNGKRRQHL